MAKLVLHHEGREYHFSFGDHKVKPIASERINVRDIDALVVEGLFESPPLPPGAKFTIDASEQANDAIKEAIRQGKPVYAVESRQLVEAVRMRKMLTIPIAVASAFTGEAIGGHFGKTNRRNFLLRGLGFVGGAATGAVLTLYDWGKAVPPTVASAFLEKRGYTKKELDELPNDAKSGVLVAQRNAVFAEALKRLSEKHRRIGIITGGAHYNIYDYLLDDKLRHEVRRGIEPEIVDITKP